MHDLAGGPGDVTAPPVGEAPPTITRYVGRKRPSSTIVRRSAQPRAGAMSATAFLAEVRRAAAATTSRRPATIEETPSSLRTRAMSGPER
jgi:hypothetical protein